MYIKVSAAMARLPFAGCSPDYIRDVCKARCCHSSTAPLGTVITIHPSEVGSIVRRGGRVLNGLLYTPDKRCTFKTDADLCGLHGTPDKPFGCVASPFTLNKTGTLIVRNRYKLLKCYKDGAKLPAYVAFRGSLDRIFGAKEAARVCDELDAGSGDLLAWISDATHEMLTTNDLIKKQVAA